MYEQNRLSRHNRRTPSRATGSVIIALLAAVVMPVAITRAAGGQGPGAGGEEPTVGGQGRGAERNDGGYDHFLYLRHIVVNGRVENTALVLAKVTPEGFQQRDIFVHPELDAGWELICVADGKVYALKDDYTLIGFDTATGRGTAIAYLQLHVYDSGRLYGIAGVVDKLVYSWTNWLRVFDFHNQRYRDVCQAQDVDGKPQSALSPDGKRLAYFSSLIKEQQPTLFRLNLVDLENETLKTLGPTVNSMVFQSSAAGAGSIADHAPSFIWLDEKTILLVRDEPGRTPLTTVRSGPSEPLLATLDVDTEQMTDILRLPRFNRRPLEPYLPPLDSDSVPRIVIGELGQYRVDLKAKQLIKDDTPIGAGDSSRRRELARLFLGRIERGQADSTAEIPIPEISVSPDGRQAVWVTTGVGPGGAGQGELRYRDLEEDSARVVAEGRFSTATLWVKAEDLELGATPKPVAGWEPFPTDPWPEEPHRPKPKADASDCLALSLSTDETTYPHREQVRVTVTLTNKTDHRLSIHPGAVGNAMIMLRHDPGNAQHAERFRDLVLVPPAESDGSGAPSPDRPPEGFFDQDPVTLAPGESFRFAGLVELSGLGRQTIETSFSISSDDYRGTVEAQPITLTVVPSVDEKAALQSQFERCMARCREEFDQGPSTCNYMRIVYLGEPAVPLLVATLEASDDPKFRQRMGFALVRIANADALPYFERLLAGHMHDDQRMVLDGLSDMIRRSQSAEGAFKLLMSALEHTRVDVRRGAAERLRGIFDPQVAAAMEAVVDDSDRETSLMAARYTAAYEWLDLADWLALAAEEPTRARYVTAGLIIEQLDAEWHLGLGDLPRAAWGELADDPAQLAQYKTVVRAWEQWARDNPRTSEHFFDTDRQNWAQPAGSRGRGTSPQSPAAGPRGARSAGPRGGG